MPKRSPSPEQPEHEEAQRMAEEAMPAQAEALAMAEHEEARRPTRPANTLEGNPVGWSNYVSALEVLLSKTEQERDEALHSVVGKHELEQARAEAFLLKGRAEAAERELERLREAYDDCHARWKIVADALEATERDLERHRALSADTQRKP